MRIVHQWNGRLMGETAPFGQGNALNTTAPAMAPSQSSYASASKSSSRFLTKTAPVLVAKAKTNQPYMPAAPVAVVPFTPSTPPASSSPPAAPPPAAQAAQAAPSSPASSSAPVVTPGASSGGGSGMPYDAPSSDLQQAAPGSPAPVSFFAEHRTLVMGVAVASVAALVLYLLSRK